MPDQQQALETVRRLGAELSDALAELEEGPWRLVVNPAGYDRQAMMLKPFKPNRDAAKHQSREPSRNQQSEQSLLGREAPSHTGASRRPPG